MSKRRRVVEDTQSPVGRIQKESKAERKLLRKRRRRRFFKRLFLFLSIIAVISGIVAFDLSSYSRVRTIEVVGNQHVLEEDVLKAYNINTGDRLISIFLKDKFKKAKVAGVANVDLKLYYTKGLITLTVKESPMVAYSVSEGNRVLLKDNSYFNTAYADVMEVPLLVGFDEALIKSNPSFADKLARMNKTAFNGISEIHLVNDPLETIYFKLIMNNGYFVYTNLKNLLLMDHYPEIVSKLEDDSNRCIYFLDDGRTDENQSAVAKPCE